MTESRSAAASVAGPVRVSIPVAQPPLSFSTPRRREPEPLARSAPPRAAFWALALSLFTEYNL